VPRKAPPPEAPGFSVAVSEADVRRLCSEGAYARGDALQWEGHVFAPGIEHQGLGGEVLGTWQRVDVVRIKAGGGQLTSECTCRSGPFCRHAAALLLHWLRARDSFVPIVEEGPPTPDRESFAGEFDYFDEDDEDLDPTASYPEQQVSPQEEYARLLEPATMQHLRAIARRRGLRVVAKNKVEMVAQLATLLSERAGIEAAIAALGDDETLTLEVANLLGAVGGAGTTSAAIIRACSTLGLAAKPSAQHFPALDTLADLALVVRNETYTMDAANCWVPYAVAAAIPPRGVLLGMSSTVRSVIPPPAKLGVTEVCQVIGYELAQGRIGVQPMAGQEVAAAALPRGWIAQSESPPSGHQSESVRALRPALFTAHEDLRRLEELTGQTPDMIDFSLWILLRLGIVEAYTEPPGYVLTIREDLLRTLFSLPPAERLDAIRTAWLDAQDLVELGMVVGEKGPLALHYSLKGQTYWAATHPNAGAVRGLVARIVGYLPAETEWYSVESLLTLCRKLAPDLLGNPNVYGGPRWWFSRPGSSRRFELTQQEDWRRVWAALVRTILTGPMSWLGLIEVGARHGEPVAFRVRPAAAVLGERPVRLERPDDAPVLLLEIDPSTHTPLVTVPPNTLDNGIHATLAAIGTMAGASPQGLRYRLTAQGVQRVFDSGASGPQLIAVLGERAGGTLPEAVQAILERWWESYGAIRLYDEVTLIELGDDLLLRELLAASSLREAVLHTFSPRLVAIDSARVDELVEELTRLGYTPRMVDEA